MASRTRNDRPRSERPPGRRPGSATTRAAMSTTIPVAAPPCRVLIVDDEPAIAHVMALVVEQRGCVPLVAADGQEALDLAHVQPPDLVITDLMMPRLDGAGLLAELRAESRAEGREPIPAILMTGARAAVLADVPADAVLVKPFRIEALLALLDRFLGPARPG